MANVWYTIPRSTTVDRGDGDEPAIHIEESFSTGMISRVLGIDGGLTLKEVEDLVWRLKQGVQLIKHGEISRQHA